MEDDFRSIPLPQADTTVNSRMEVRDELCPDASASVSGKILFLSGYGTKPGETNPNVLRTHGYTVIEPDLPDGDFARSVILAQRVFNRHQPEVVVGWSRGGAVAMSIDRGGAPLILIAPAWKNWGTVTTVKPEVTILHSPHDDLVSIEDSLELLEKSGLAPQRLMAVGEDHRMIDEEAFGTLLEAVASSRKSLDNRQAA
ncbi:MAG: alpha/beta hydrolase [Thermoguttaceae bacterium]